MKIRKIALLATLMAATASGPAMAYDRVITWPLVFLVNGHKIHDHLEQLQRIASRNNNTRALGTPGYAASVRYVAERMRRAHYDVTVQPFIANLFTENNPPVLEETAPNPTTYTPDTDFVTMQFSGAGDVTGQLIPVDLTLPPSPAPSSTSGCEDSDFTAEVSGNIALIQRGTCTFEDKAQNAFQAGAIGVVIFNEGQPGRTEVLSGTLTNKQDVPVVGTTFAVGDELAAATTPNRITVHINVDAVTTPVRTWNVLAEKRGRVRNQDVVVGAHLDSVDAGPGINDNGSGTATLLTIAEQMARLHIQPRNTVRFAFWGAEEEGLIGSTYYVDTLPADKLARIALNLNFDMLGSPNFARFVYDGNGTLGSAGPPGSDVIEKVFTDFFRFFRLASEPTAFDGRSDYFEFINAGIPAGGLFSGAEGIKTAQQQRKYGGTAGVAYDSCYHQACDTIRNLSLRSLDQLGRAAAHAVAHFAMTRQNIRPPAAAAARLKAAASAADYRGPRLIR